MLVAQDWQCKQTNLSSLAFRLLSFVLGARILILFVWCTLLYFSAFADHHFPSLFRAVAVLIFSFHSCWWSFFLELYYPALHSTFARCTNEILPAYSVLFRPSQLEISDRCCIKKAKYQSRGIVAPSSKTQFDPCCRPFSNEAAV